MSTRSGKRLHNSVIDEEITNILKPKRKTRGNKQKENCDNDESVPKKKHFVRYPSEDDINIADCPSEGDALIHKPLRSTLQEINGLNLEDSHIEKKPIRQTRRTKKIEEEIVSNEISAQDVKKKSKKKKVSSNNDGNKNENVIKNKLSKKKKKKKSSLVEQSDNVEVLNRSNLSVDSFHSAAGSTLEDQDKLMHDAKINIDSSHKLLKSFDGCCVEEQSNNNVDSPLKQCEQNFEDVLTVNNNEPSVNHVVKKIKKKKIKKRSINTGDKDSVELTMEAMINTEDITENSKNKQAKKKSKISKEIDVKTNIEAVLNSTFEKEKSVSKSSLQNSTFDKIEITANVSSVEKVTDKGKRRSSLILLNNSHEIIGIKQKPNGSIKSLNSTYDKTPDSQKKMNKKENALNTTFEKESSSKLDTTFEKDTGKLNSTFEKLDEKVNLDTTFDKTSDNSKKSSLLSSDRSNMTDDKSNNSRISITSDDSRENIVNTTPVLIESSMEQSFAKEASPEQNKLKRQSIVSPHTPLKREGTFTKESNSPITKNTDKTPSKRASMASPGCTPFPSSKSSSKNKSVLNVTRSIEKSRRSSLIHQPRVTKVMFCSPVNNPVIINQMKGQIIKSNLKGSNKSFVFNESVSDIVSSSRKRSYTQSDADDVSVKRKRLAEDLQQSVDRLSRPRTVSASAKLQETTPSKQTPQKMKEKVSRTKLPNFAALHQKQFSKMESLDECQERKAKRARRMLVGASGKPSPKSKDSKTKETKKAETPVKSRLPTLESLNPGYTRFGFKMNSDVNPFANSTMNDVKADISTKTHINSTKTNIDSTKTNLNSTKTDMNSTKTDLDSTKNDVNSTKSDIFRISTKPIINPFTNMTNTTVKSKAMKQNELKRQTALPSLAGSTVRKEMAKQTIMREKSFTEKRNVNRKENRTIIKGVRTNRRFELQMKLRNIN